MRLPFCLFNFFFTLIFHYSRFLLTNIFFSLFRILRDRVFVSELSEFSQPEQDVDERKLWESVFQQNVH